MKYLRYLVTQTSLRSHLTWIFWTTQYLTYKAWKSTVEWFHFLIIKKFVWSVSKFFVLQNGRHNWSANTRNVLKYRIRFLSLTDNEEITFNLLVTKWIAEIRKLINNPFQLWGSERWLKITSEQSHVEREFFILTDRVSLSYQKMMSNYKCQREVYHETNLRYFVFWFVRYQQKLKR